MKKNLLIILIFLTTPLIAAGPWGKDADLAHRRKMGCEEACKEGCGTLLLGPFAEVMIKFHQEVISPADGPRSHFYPSSSQYTLDAMRKYGFLGGFFMGCDRLMRENPEPWVYRTIDRGGNTLKYDPVR
jgi:putative component of membrane protein insertase Oxa1/YidC/SpoIIIJ protein YidD